jgi:RNA polymerase sigma-70 factor (ECF subfamily)
VEAAGKVFELRQDYFMTAAGAQQTPPDLALVETARAGQPDAFGRLYGSYAPLVHGILMARVPRDEVDDLLQDVFLSAFRKLHTLRDPSAFGPWLAMIARNRARDYHRHSPAVAELPDDLPAKDAREAEAAGILALIRTLPESYRETLVLRLVEGLTGPEIAARTGLTPASVRVNLHRGMKQLREKLVGGRHA